MTSFLRHARNLGPNLGWSGFGMTFLASLSVAALHTTLMANDAQAFVAPEACTCTPNLPNLSILLAGTRLEDYTIARGNETMSIVEGRVLRKQIDELKQREERLTHELAQHQRALDELRTAIKRNDVTSERQEAAQLTVQRKHADDSAQALRDHGQRLERLDRNLQTLTTQERDGQQRLQRVEDRLRHLETRR